MLKWSRKKVQIFLFLSLFSLFMLSFHLTTDNSTTVRVSRPSFPTHTTTKVSDRILDALEWSNSCNSTRSYHRESSSELNTRRRSEHNPKKCDLFSGRWIYDNVSHPLYKESSCAYMSDQLACTKHGRLDIEYQRWRWQPHGCYLKRWNGLEMLEKLRNKRLMFVGDSLNRGQWISMVCLLQSLIPDGKHSMSPNAPLTIFKAKEYNASVEFYWAPLIVESNSDDPVNHRLDHRIIRPNSLLKHATKWEKADILVFNSYLWWRSGTKIKLLRNADDTSVCEDADGIDAMRLALETWANWVDTRVNFKNQKIFYVTMSPTHLWSKDWSPGSEGNCYNEKTPILDNDSYWGTGSDQDTMSMVANILNGLGSKVSVINITQLSEYRKDGHPSIYRKFWETFTEEQLSNPSTYSDCIHWCLPGVPDVWNELLFNLL